MAEADSMKNNKPDETFLQLKSPKKEKPEKWRSSKVISLPKRRPSINLDSSLANNNILAPPLNKYNHKSVMILPSKQSVKEKSKKFSRKNVIKKGKNPLELMELCKLRSVNTSNYI